MKMRKGNSFFRKNQYKIATAFVLAAILGIAGTYMFTGEKDEKEQQIAMEKPQDEAGKSKGTNVGEEVEKVEEETEQTSKVSAVIQPKEPEEVEKETEQPQIAGQEVAQEPMEQEETVETINTQKTATELHFDTEKGLMWPVNGAVIIDYSMDQTVYFTTLDQYKYNPAVIISGNVNDKVKAAASGKIIDVSTNEVTGCTVTMDIGDGYTAIYGQLKEVPYEAGTYLEAGNTLGFVNEPTKYYALEGSNVYFALEKDGTPVDPVEFFQ